MTFEAAAATTTTTMSEKLQRKQKQSERKTPAKAASSRQRDSGTAAQWNDGRSNSKGKGTTWSGCFNNEPQTEVCFYDPPLLPHM